MIIFQVEASDTIRSLKEKIERAEGIPPEDQKLSFLGQPLDDDNSTLADYNLRNQSTVLLHRYFLE